MKRSTIFFLVFLFIAAILILWVVQRNGELSAGPSQATPTISTAPTLNDCISDESARALDPQLPEGAEKLHTEYKECSAYILVAESDGKRYLWQFSYDGEGQRLHEFAPKSGDKILTFSNLFWIDNEERYVATQYVSAEGLVYVNVRDIQTWESLVLARRNPAYSIEQQRWEGEFFRFHIIIDKKPYHSVDGDIDMTTRTVSWSDDQ